jgi:hypothetical protein
MDTGANSQHLDRAGCKDEARDIFWVLDEVCFQEDALRLRPLWKRLEVPHETRHGFRHARVSHLRRQGVPHQIIKESVRHSSLMMTDLYMRFDAEYEQKIAAQCGLSVSKGPISPTVKHKQVA